MTSRAGRTGRIGTAPARTREIGGVLRAEI